MLPRVFYISCGALVICVAVLGLVGQRWAVMVNERAEEHLRMQGMEFQELLKLERKAKEEALHKLDDVKANFSKQSAVWSEWNTRFETWAKTDEDKVKKYCAISEISLGYDERFFPKAAELRIKLDNKPYPTFEQLYWLVVNKVYDEKNNIWSSFPNAYNMKPSYAFPFSNLGDAHVEQVFQKLQRPPKFVVEVGSFHGHSAIKFAKALDKHGFKDIPLLCIDPWVGDLGMILFRDDWDKKLTPGELADGRSTSYYQFMLNVKSEIDAGSLGPRHIIPLATTSTIGARYLFALGLTPDLIFLDSAHEKDETYTEISLFWNVLAPGGVLYGDDFSWASVNTDVNRFAERNQLQVLTSGVVWMLQKEVQAEEGITATGPPPQQPAVANTPAPIDMSRFVEIR